MLQPGESLHAGNKASARTAVDRSTAKCQGRSVQHAEQLTSALLLMAYVAEGHSLHVYVSVMDVPASKLEARPPGWADSRLQQYTASRTGDSIMWYMKERSTVPSSYRVVAANLPYSMHHVLMNMRTAPTPQSNAILYVKRALQLSLLHVMWRGESTHLPLARRLWWKTRLPWLRESTLLIAPWLLLRFWLAESVRVMYVCCDAVLLSVPPLCSRPAPTSKMRTFFSRKHPMKMSNSETGDRGTRTKKKNRRHEPVVRDRRQHIYHGSTGSWAAMMTTDDKTKYGGNGRYARGEMYLILAARIAYIYVLKNKDLGVQ